MNKPLSLFLVSSILLVCCLPACNPKTETETKANVPALFESIDSTKSGITFTNPLKPNTELNIIDYIYYYNGGGVAVGDINNDGLPDLYFTANQAANRLYLNKGNFQFDDITNEAGVAGTSQWSTGTTMADVNGDGWLDIYVCSVSGFAGLRGKNELFINQGNNTFKEEAAAYGLDFEGFGTHSAFFDYDKDGDLDCYLLNHAVHDANSYTSVSVGRETQSLVSGDHLLRNDGSQFTNVSRQAGILQASIGYGLGVAVADYNQDGWEDIYISNDFHEDDYLYINQKNGQFKEQARDYFKHFSRFSMGSDAADFNNDGLTDLMTLDMLPQDHQTEKESLSEDPFDIYLYKLSFGYYNQYSRNCLQLNQGGQKFSEIASLAGVAATDWSWSPLFADFDLDGNKDLFISNGIVKRPNNLDYMNYVYDYAQKNPSTIDSKEYYYKAFELMPSGVVHNYLFKGTGDSLYFRDYSNAWGFTQPDISNGAAYADLDNDGDLDLVTNRIDRSPGLWRNNQQGGNYLKIALQGNGKNPFGVGARVTLFQGSQQQVQHLMPSRGFQSSVEPLLVFGLGNAATIDSLRVEWPSGKTQTQYQIKGNQTIRLLEKESTQKPITNTRPIPTLVTSLPSLFPWKHQENDFHDFNREPLMPFKISTEGPALAIGDVNGDGLEDVFLGGAKMQAGSLWLQGKNQGFAASKQPALEKDNLFEDVDAAFLDVDGDKDLDLYVVSGGNEFYGAMVEQYDRLYLNDGKGNFSPASADALPPMPTNKSCVRPADFDGDGDIDLFVGGRVVSNAYGYLPDSYLLQNNGKGRFANVTTSLAPALKKAGMVTDARWADMDGDKRLDLVVVGEWMPVTIYYASKSRFEAKTLPNSRGLWHSIAIADINKDGKQDMVAGNLGTNTKLRKGATPKLRLQALDVDKNGQTEQIISYQSEGKWWPLAHKDELGKVLPAFIKKRFVVYKEYANQTIDGLFEPKQLEGAVTSEVDLFSSMCYLNTGSKSFAGTPLPTEAQFSAVYTLLPDDYNNDGHTDVLLGGNLYDVNPYQSRYDASYGVLLLGNSQGSWQVKQAPETGFWLDGNVRKIAALQTPKGKRWLVARNNDSVSGLQPSH